MRRVENAEAWSAGRQGVALAKALWSDAYWVGRHWGSCKGAGGEQGLGLNSTGSPGCRGHQRDSLTCPPQEGVLTVGEGPRQPEYTFPAGFWASLLSCLSQGLICHLPRAPLSGVPHAPSILAWTEAQGVPTPTPAPTHHPPMTA